MTAVLGAPAPSPAPLPPVTTAPLVAPGWRLAANLLPPEVLQARRVRAVRRTNVIVLIVVLVVVAGGFVAATWRTHVAADRLAEAQATTTRLMAQQRQFAGVVQVKAQTARLSAQGSTLTAHSVDMQALLAALRGALPGGVSITQLTVTLDGDGQGAGSTTSAAGSSGGAGALDASGQRHIGSVTITGAARRLDDVSAYVDRLGKIAGVVQPYPASSHAGAATVDYSLQLTLTDRLWPVAPARPSAGTTSPATGSATSAQPDPTSGSSAGAGTGTTSTAGTGTGTSTSTGSSTGTGSTR